MDSNVLTVLGLKLLTTFMYMLARFVKSPIGAFSSDFGWSCLCVSLSQIKAVMFPALFFSPKPGLKVAYTAGLYCDVSPLLYGPYVTTLWVSSLSTSVYTYVLWLLLSFLKLNRHRSHNNWAGTTVFPEFMTKTVIKKTLKQRGEPTLS